MSNKMQDIKYLDRPGVRIEGPDLADFFPRLVLRVAFAGILV